MPEDIVISVKNLVKNYSNGKGVFDFSMQINRGEIFGLLGPNGAGKTTTIRHILGFQKPEKGEIRVNNIDPWYFSDIVNSGMGYIPGEIAFPNFKNGWEFINQMAKFKSMDNIDYAKELVKRFSFDPSCRVKTMSKGMKQKLAIVTAFMNKPNTLILDEPTSGLDPLMQLEFDKLVLEFKAAGATILLSSHIFSEIEKVCDKVCIIKDGKKIYETKIENIRHDENKNYKIEFIDKKQYQEFLSIATKNQIFENLKNVDERNQIFVTINQKNTNTLTQYLAKYDIKYIQQNSKTLEETFMKYYSNDTNYSFRDIKKQILTDNDNK
ncbi:MAG: ABC transporter ATP-binding protein [Mycoplasmataceae bacterium]|nr:ABC transporter ATP-binding protein [Mycoplasmataceae bacterium]